MALTGNKETKRQKDAFEIYYALGEERSYKAVAEITGFNFGTIASWGGKFNWQHRVEQRDLQLAEIMKKTSQKETVVTREQLRKIIRVAIRKFAKNLIGNKVSVDTVSDFEKLVKLDLILSGEMDAGGELIKIKIEDAREKVHSRISSIAEREEERELPQ